MSLPPGLPLIPSPVSPWSTSADAHRATAIEHRFAVTVLDAAGEVPVEVDPDGRPRLAFDEAWTPHVQLSNVLGPVPELVEVLDRIDPRANVRVRVEAGYVYPDGTVDVHDLAVLRLTHREVRRPDNTIEVRGDGDEVLIVDAHQPIAANTPTDLVFAADQRHIDVVSHIVKWYGQTPPPTPGDSTSPSPLVVDAAVPTTTLGAELVVKRTDDLWRVAADIADRLDAWLRFDGLTWRLTPRPAIGVTSAVLRTGPGGTVTQSSSRLTRDEWANTVVVHYANGLAAIAVATSGPRGVPAAPRKVLTVDRETMPATGGAAAARAILARAFSRGRSLVLSAPAAYWLRPGHTVEVTLPTGGTELHLVARVDFDLAAGSMEVTTRLPETVTVTSSGGA